MESIDGFAPLIKILTEISGKSGQKGSNSVKNGLAKTEPENRLEPASAQGLVPKRVIETLVDVAGIEPEAPCAETSVSIKDFTSLCLRLTASAHP